MTEKIEKSLKSIELLRELPSPLIAQLADFSLIRTVRAGETIFCQGEPSPYCFGVVSGEVAIQRMSADKEYPVKVLGVLGPGALFGESALFDATARTAMATARKNGELVAIMGNKFREWINKDSTHGHPLLMGMLRHALDRLRETSGELSIIYGLDRILGETESIENRLSAALDFLRASLPALEAITLYRRNPYWDEYEPWIAQPPSGTELGVLGLETADVQTIQAATSATLMTGSGSPIILVPLIDRDKNDQSRIGFLRMAIQEPLSASPHMLLLLSSIAIPFAEVLLRQHRQDDLLAQARLNQSKQSFTI